MKLIILSDTHIKPGQSLVELLPGDLVTIIKNSDILIHALLLGIGLLVTAPISSVFLANATFELSEEEVQ
ncbi:hypothetical protein HNV12_11700 [Methanococcoides sp. SA1]|nr:hypothetical protein [Methanococcoides sp. SA1]